MQRNEFQWNATAATKKMKAATMLALAQWAEYVLQQAREIVPLDEATLERSGVASTDPAAMAAAVSFDTPYAVIQHESFDLLHAPGRQAKYLEVPWLASQDIAADLIAAQLRRALR